MMKMVMNEREMNELGRFATCFLIWVFQPVLLSIQEGIPPATPPDRVPGQARVLKVPENLYVQPQRLQDADEKTQQLQSVKNCELSAHWDNFSEEEDEDEDKDESEEDADWEPKEKSREAEEDPGIKSEPE